MIKAIFYAVSVALMVVVVAVSAGKMEGKHKGGQHMKNMTCKGETMDNKHFWVGQKECWAEIFPNSGTTPKPEDVDAARKEFMKKFKENELCFDICKWKKQGFLNADGTYNKDGTDKFIKSVFPAKVQADMKKAFDDCADANGKSLSTDNKCASYKALKECKVKKFMEICEVKFDKSSEEN